MKLGHDNPVTATLSGLLDRTRTQPSIRALTGADRADGQVIMVTGANRGLGLGVSEELAMRGARVIMACRSGIPEAGRGVTRKTGAGAVEMRQVDLSDFASIDGFCDALRDDGVQLNALVLNAGIVPAAARRTEQGFELMFGVNYLANMVMVQRLLHDGVIPNRTYAGRDWQGARARVIFVSSETHRDAGAVQLESLGRYEDYGAMGGVKVYGYSKLLLNTYAAELSRRLQDERGVDVAVHSLCPGAVDSDIAREAPQWVQPALKLVFKAFFRPPEQAAEPVLYLTLARELEGTTGRYLHVMAEKPAGENSLDETVGKRLWERSETLIAEARQRMGNP